MKRKNIIDVTDFPQKMLEDLLKYHNGIAYFSDDLDQNSIKIGSLVRKVNSEEGDIVPDGTEGKVIGSVSIPIKMGEIIEYGYAVMWNSMTVPVSVVGSRLLFMRMAEKSKKQIGLSEIDEAQWIKDKFKTLHLHVTDKNGDNIHCFLQLRQPYCDRGHIQLNIDGPLSLDEADCFPRYFFSFEEADKHTRLFLKWRLWKHRVFKHELEVK